MTKSRCRFFLLLPVWLWLSGGSALVWGQTMPYTEQEKKLLHEIARTAIAARLAGKPLPPLPSLTPALREKRGAFVTLHLDHQLRGCIGTIEPVKPLAEVVQEMAVAAAFQDPRFPPLSPRELERIDIEISVLTPLELVKNVEEIEVGKHGLLVERGFRRGLLLPQVATEYGWNRQTFLEHTCLKAGLPPTAWQDPETRIYRFSAEIF